MLVHVGNGENPHFTCKTHPGLGRWREDAFIPSPPPGQGLMALVRWEIPEQLQPKGTADRGDKAAVGVVGSAGSWQRGGASCPLLLSIPRWQPHPTPMFPFNAYS